MRIARVGEGPADRYSCVRTKPLGLGSRSTADAIRRRAVPLREFIRMLQLPWSPLMPRLPPQLTFYRREAKQ